MDTSGLLGTWCRRWAVTPDGPRIRGNTAVVLPVRTRRGRPAILRVGRPGGDDATAWAALRAWRGDGAVELFRHDAVENVSLLERLDPGRTLDALPIEEAIDVAAALRAQLIRPAPSDIPDGTTLLRRWEASLRGASAADPSLADAADRCHALRVTLRPPLLVNADLHYRNVLAGRRMPWLVIDPHPVAVEAEFGTAALLWGRWPEADPLALLDVVVDAGALDAERARGWAVVVTSVKLLGPVGPRTSQWRAVLDRLLTGRRG